MGPLEGEVVSGLAARSKDSDVKSGSNYESFRKNFLGWRGWRGAGLSENDKLVCPASGSTERAPI